MTPVNVGRVAQIVWIALAQSLTSASYFPITSKAGAEGVTPFEAKWYGTALERMNEPQLQAATKNLGQDVYRLTILPTWGNPISIRVQKHGETYSVHSRRLDGQGGYDPGRLVEAKDVELSAGDSEVLARLIENLNFMRIPSEENIAGMDGDQWIFEGVSQGRYHVMVRWCASSYNVKKRGLRPFRALCKFLVDKSTLSERPKNAGQKLI